MKVISKGNQWKTEPRRFKCGCGSIVEACASEGKEYHSQGTGSAIIFSVMPCCGCLDFWVELNYFKRPQTPV